MVDVWYPAAIDSVHGGFLSTFDYQWQAAETQPKFIVTQARHLWTLSKLAERYPDRRELQSYADHGFRFLKETLRDDEFGGYHSMLHRDGSPDFSSGDGKLIYGQAFVTYALAAYAEMSGSEEALSLAQESFRWIEDHAFDEEYGGYFQATSRDGTPQPVETTANPSNTDWLSYKDQNTTIHLLEAYTELYQVWPDAKVRERLSSLLTLLRDTIVQERGYMHLFFTRDWQKVSFEDSVRRHWRHGLTGYQLMDHVSFGHDIEAAFLMLEAREALGLEDERTPEVARQLVDHTIRYGFDGNLGGLYERGYYFADTVTIISDTKTWWAQGEAMNSLLLFAQLYPEDVIYFREFERLWLYVNSYFLDWEHGGWYAQGIDRQPEFRERAKAHNWKGPYHTVRSLMLCSDRLKSLLEP